MSNQSNRSEGVAEQIGGKIKKGIGQLVGDDAMAAEGEAKELRGEARESEAKAAERSKGRMEQMVGAVKNRVGHVVDHEKMAAEGKAEELRGEHREKRNQ